MNAGLKDAADDILKESVTLRTCFSIPKKTTFIKKMLNTQLPSINQFQKDAVISAATAQPPEVIGDNLKKTTLIEKMVITQLPSINQFQKDPVISAATAQPPEVIGENLNCFQKLNTPTDIDIVVPVNRKTVNFNSKCLKESHLKDSSIPNLTTPCFVFLEKPNFTPPESELKKFKSAANTTTIKAPSKRKPKKKLKSAANTTTIKKKKGVDAIIKSIIENILKEEGIQDEKEQIKRENIVKKCLLKFEEKEEKKRVKYFQKTFFRYINKSRDNFNKMGKKVINTVKDKTKLLKVIRKLNCKDKSDVGQLIKHFIIESKPCKKFTCK
ncbi:hypothetical protein TNCV_2457601 [Trichonephila clavipes]|nr:hypothetical protein TNCV_2457601 [Trichonephila clavipes]